MLPIVPVIGHHYNPNPTPEDYKNKTAPQTAFGPYQYLIKKILPSLINPTLRVHGVHHVALAWMLARPFVTAPIIGANNTDQLADSMGAPDLVLSAAAAEPTREARATRLALAGAAGAGVSSAAVAATAAGSDVLMSRVGSISAPIQTPSASPRRPPTSP